MRASMEESLMQILRPKRRIDILRDVEEAASKGKPYVITFCGVNGVGKSTNLAKVGPSPFTLPSLSVHTLSCLSLRLSLCDCTDCLLAVGE